jgi:polar amino acid transport system substrate-binding protein
VLVEPDALAGDLSEIRQRGALRWGGDQSGGAPYIFEGPDGELTGFDYELARYLADSLGVRSEFVQGQWDKLPQLLERGDIDLVLNGYEWTPEREREWPSTVPYYVYELQLMARSADGSIRSWEDLLAASGAPRRVGVLAGSAAERYAQARVGRTAEVLAYDGVTNALELVQQGQLDATVQDLPIAIHYGPLFPALSRIGDPVEPGYYVGYTRRADGDLRRALDEAILRAAGDGTLRRIFDRYGLWNAAQERLADLGKAWPPADLALRDEPELPRFTVLLARAAWTTVELACLSMPLAIVIGVLVAIGRLYGPRWVAWPLGGYVELLRGTPLLLQLYVIYYLLPRAGVRIPEFWAGVLGLAINYSAYEAENYRAGLLAIPRGQMETALSLGMSTRTALRRVILPQAMKIVIPPVTNDFVALFKDTSVCSVIAVTELTGMYNRLYNNHPGMVLELGLLTAALYLLMSYPLALATRRLEKRLEQKYT